MILAFDSYYFDDKAKTVSISFGDWHDEYALQIKEETLRGVASYEPGAFYKRELPCILSLLKQWDLAVVDTIIIDGYVVLDDDGSLGLGGYLYEELKKSIPIIGVAKTKYQKNNNNVIEVKRGISANPLNISALGIGMVKAAKLIESMHGIHRMPTLLQKLDSLTKASK